VSEPVKIDGLSRFVRSLKQMDSDLPKAVRKVLNSAVEIVIDFAAPRVPRRTGRAARSLRSRSTRTEARASGGDRRAPHFPWLDFGGKVGPNRSVERPFIREGRYLYKGLAERRTQVHEAALQGLIAVAASAGIEVE
jgi:hypothetical protein